MLMIVMGKSGSGKNAVAGKLMESHGYERVITCTTRAPRGGETGDEYHFMSQDTFLARMEKGDFIESDIYGKNWYGTLKESLQSDGKLICIMTPDGAKAVKAAFPDAFVVHIAPSMKTSVMRAINREKELTPGIMERIHIRATQDYYLFGDVPCNHLEENESDAVLEDVAARIAAAHAAHCQKYEKERNNGHV